MIPLFKVNMSPAVPEAVGKVLMSGYIGQGEAVEEFEAAFRKFIGYPAVAPLTVNSCTSAIDLALHLCDIGAGDRVITTAQTCTATNTHIVLRGAVPIWADVEPMTGLIKPESVQEILKIHDARAIIAVDWAGRPCDYGALRSFGLPVIQDAAHRGPGRLAGAGDYVCWSFQAIKHLTTGDGGALLVPEAQYRRAKLLRWYGLDREGKADFRCEQNIRETGYKYHMNDIAATIGLCNLGYAGAGVLAATGNAMRLYEGLQALPGVYVPPWEADCDYWLFTILVGERDDFQAHMTKRGIATSQVHARNDTHAAFRSGISAPDTRGLEWFSRHQVSIPCGWWLTEEDLTAIISAVREWSNGRA